jgi:hypothetical protein
MEKFLGQITTNMNPDLMMQVPAKIAAQMHGPVANQSSAQDCGPNSNQQMLIRHSTYVYQTHHNNPNIQSTHPK